MRVAPSHIKSDSIGSTLSSPSRRCTSKIVEANRPNLVRSGHNYWCVIKKRRVPSRLAIGQGGYIKPQDVFEALFGCTYILSKTQSRLKWGTWIETNKIHGHPKVFFYFFSLECVWMFIRTSLNGEFYCIVSKTAISLRIK